MPVNREKDEKQRTLLQNRSMHKYFTLVAEKLNEAGLERKITITMGADVPWSPETIKEVIWRSLQYGQTGKHSTTELTTKEYGEVWETMNRFMGENFNIHVPIPSLEEQLLERQTKEKK